MDDLREMNRRRFLTMLGGGIGGTMVLGGLIPTSVSYAKAAYPSDKIAYIVPYAPGGGNDLSCRAVAQFMTKHVKAVSPNPSKVGVVIKNIPGGSGMKGIKELYNADPDGYTIGHAEDFLFTRSILGQLGFDPFELTYLARIASDRKLLVTGSKNSKIQTWDDVVKLSKQNPIIFANALFATANHVGTIMIIDATGISARMVLTGSGASTNAALIRGDVNLALNNEDTCKELIAAGELRPIVSFSDKSPFPGCPTIKDIGYPELVDGIRASRYIIAPYKLPANIKDILVTALKKTVTDKEFITWNKKVNLTFDPIFGPEADAWTRKMYGFYKKKEALLRKYLLKQGT